MSIRWQTILGAALCLSAAAETVPNHGGVLIELFTSEGCSSCPPADALLKKLDDIGQADGAELVVLSEHVDYWNRFGWTDPYSSADFTVRQQHYAERLSKQGAYTPQMVVDGEAAFVGSDVARARLEIERAARHAVRVVEIIGAERRDDWVKFDVSAEGRKGTIVMVALAEARAETDVKRGENSGLRLTHVAVARVLKQAGRIGKDGAWRKTVWLEAPAKWGSVRVIAFEAEGETCKVLGVSQVKM